MPTCMLYDNKAIPRNQLDQDQSKLEQAQVAYDQALEQAKLGAVSGYNGNSVQYAQPRPSASRRSSTLKISSSWRSRTSSLRSTATIQTVATQPSDALRRLQSGDAVTEGQACSRSPAGAATS